MRARATGFGLSLLEPKRATLAVSFLVLFGLFATNTDWGGDPESPRGDGKYRPVLARGDGHMMYLMARSLVFDRDLIYDNDLADFGDPWRQPKTATGRKAIPHPIGPPLVWAPFLILGNGAALVANAFGADIATHGYTMLHQRIVFATSVFFAFFAVVIGMVVFRRTIGPGWSSIYAAVAVLFGTSITYYATNMPSYGHAMDAFFCALFLGTWVLTIGDRRWRRFILLGFLLGISALIRTQDLGLGVVVAIEVLWLFSQSTDGATRSRHVLSMALRGGLALGCAMVAMIPQFIAWKLTYGEFVTSPSGPNFMRLGHPLISELLFASRNGWLSTHPIAYAGVIGLLVFMRRRPLIGLGLVAALLVQVWINASVFDWWAGAAFGARRLCSMTAVLVIGLATLIHASGQMARRLPRWSRHAIAFAVFGWFLTWNMSQVQRLRKGKAAGHPVAASCCSRLPKPMQSIAKPVYKAIGNPFSFPANALFAAKHDVPLARWDRAVGHYVYIPPLDQYMDGRYRRHRAAYRVGGGGADKYITGGFDRGRRDAATGYYRWTVKESATMIVPVLLPEPLDFKLEIVSARPGQRIRVRLNGDVMAEKTLSGRKETVEFVAPMSVLIVGSNVVSIETDIAARPKAAPAGPARVGVAVATLWLTFPALAPKRSR